MKGFENYMPNASLFQAIFYSPPVPVVLKTKEIPQNKKRSTIIKIKHQ